MTWRDWHEQTDPDTMLGMLRGRISQRKVRLFAVACCRRVWHLLDAPNRRAVEIAERYADGEVSRSQLAKAHDAVRPGTRGASLARGVSHRLIETAQHVWWQAAVLHAADASPRHRAEVAGAEQEIQCALLRDIAGGVGRPAVSAPWLAWEGGTIIKFARAIYEGRRFDDLPILADALEDAGCSDEDLLQHCRGSGPHARGCWALDLLLGRR
ncbi:MAG: hypothetical protein HYS12_26215 [Planctomycetes bacterium]|nr:hypothetical protein [Planctomycetota bacterium]